MAIKRFHVKGAADPSSKQDRGKLPAWGVVRGAVGLFVKEVIDGPTVDGMDVIMDKLGFEKGSFRDREMGDMPLIESMDVAGEIPSRSDLKERRWRG